MRDILGLKTYKEAQMENEDKEIAKLLDEGFSKAAIIKKMGFADSTGYRRIKGVENERNT